MAPPGAFCRGCAATVAVIAGGLGGSRTAVADWGPFGSPQAVTIAGYAAGAEEPFITPDGRYLLFNGSEEQPDFSLQFASRLDAQSFEYDGPVLGEGVNVPEAFSAAGMPGR